MRTLGIDLAAKDENTALCAVVWRPDGAAIAKIERPCTDESLLAEIAQADRVGIDAPFGWPDAFVEAVGAHHRGAQWPANTSRLPLCLRLTDRVVADSLGRQPLSVSADKLAVPAMRCAYLLDRLARASGPVDRTGKGRVAEVYPAAALKRWGIEPRKSKRTAGAPAREAIVEHLARDCRGLVLEPSTRESLVSSDHAIDALLAALVARAIALGETLGPGADQLEVARREGWIHVPREGSLARLVAGARPPVHATAP